MKLQKSTLLFLLILLASCSSENNEDILTKNEKQRLKSTAFNNIQKPKNNSSYTITYNGSNEAIKIQNTKSLSTQSISYDSNGRIATVNWESFGYTFTYDNSGKLTEILYKNNNGKTLNYIYTYNEKGLVSNCKEVVVNGNNNYDNVIYDCFYNNNNQLEKINVDNTGNTENNSADGIVDHYSTIQYNSDGAIKNKLTKTTNGSSISELSFVYADIDDPIYKVVENLLNEYDFLLYNLTNNRYSIGGGISIEGPLKFYPKKVFKEIKYNNYKTNTTSKTTFKYQQNENLLPTLLEGTTEESTGKISNFSKTYTYENYN